MFEPPNSGKTPSLLMRARASERRNHTDAAEPNADDHKAARVRRGEKHPNPLLAALGRAADAQPAHAVASAPASADRERSQRAAFAPQSSHDPMRRDNDGALVDPAALIGTIWRWRYTIAGLTVLGGIAGVLIALSSQPRYTASSQILLDPRELQLVGRELEQEFLANEAALAIVDSRLSLVQSRPVLERVIEATNLDQDPEFNGTDDQGLGLSDGLSVIFSLFSNETPVETSDRVTIENLRDAISIERETRTFVVEVSVEADSARKAALLANEVTAAFIEEQGSITTDKARTANTALTGRLDELRAEAETAERRVEAFRAENGLVSTQGRLLSEDEVAVASAQLSEARAITIRAQSRADAAGATTVDAAISGAIPADLNTGALTTFRAQLSSLRQTAAQLQNQLGPRHPRLASAQAAVEAARQDIAAELRRIAQGAQAELRRAVQTEQELAAQVARAKAALTTENDALVSLRDLQTDAEAARAIYNSALLRTRETGEAEQVGMVNASILAEAEPPIDPSSISRRTIAMAGAFAGFMLGMGMAFIAGLVNAVHLGPIAGHRFEADDAQTNFDDNGPKPQRTSTKQDEDAMYSGYPYAPHAPHPHQPVSGYPQPMAAPVAQWPQQQPMPPVPAYAPMQQPPAPGYPPSGPYGYQQSPYPPMPAPAPPMAPPPHYGYWPVAAAQPVAPQTYPPQPQPGREDREIDDLRQSVRDIREVVEELAARRSIRSVG